MIRTISVLSTAALMVSAGMSAVAQEAPTARVANAIMVSVERNGAQLPVEDGTELQTGDIIKLSNNEEIVVNEGFVTFGDVTCTLTSGIAYRLNLGAGISAKNAGEEVCVALLDETAFVPLQAEAAAAGAGTGTATGAAGAGNAPLIIGGIVVAAGGIAAAAGGGGGDDTPATPTSP